MSEKLLTKKEVAAKLGIHPFTLYNWIKDGLIEKPKKIGKKEYFTEAQIERILNPEQSK